MKLEKAIEILNDLLDFGLDKGFPATEASIRLGIEALKREQLFRERVPKKDWSLLPGETKD